MFQRPRPLSRRFICSPPRVPVRVDGSYFFTCLPLPLASLPEPAFWVLLAGAIALLFLRWRRRGRDSGIGL